MGLELVRIAAIRSLNQWRKLSIQELTRGGILLVNCFTFTEVVCNSSCPITLKSTTFSLVTGGEDVGSALLVSEMILSLDELGTVVAGGLDGKTFGVTVFSGCLVTGGAMASPAIPAIASGASATGSFGSVGLGLVGWGWTGGRRAIFFEGMLGGRF